MKIVEEVEAAVKGLSRADLAVFRNWFFEFDASVWDTRFAEDVASGRLDSIADKAIRDLCEKRSTDF